MEKWLIIGLGQEPYKMSLEYLVSHREEIDKVILKDLRNHPEDAPTTLKGHD